MVSSFCTARSVCMCVCVWEGGGREGGREGEKVVGEVIKASQGADDRGGV